MWLYLPLTLLVVVLGLGLWAWRTVEGLGRVDVSSALKPAVGNGVNYLLVGSDSRRGMTRDTPGSGGAGEQDVTGSRSDTIILLRIGDTGATMMSIPRDLWVVDAKTGQPGKINGSFNSGPANLVATVTKNLGVPIQHYVEIDFMSFAAMVDAMGGITINFPHPVTDDMSGLNITTAGDQRLDGNMALAYVRSRHYTELIDGKQRQDPRADIGRQERQQSFIRQVLSNAGEVRSPLKASRLVNAVAGGVRVDQDLGMLDTWRLGSKLKGKTPETVVLPTRPERKGAQDALVLIDGEARPVLDRFSG